MQDPIVVQLTKIISDNDNIRTNETIGNCFDLPRKGYPFVLFCRSIVIPDLGPTSRMITTSMVESCEAVSPTTWVFRTLNSVYELELLALDTQW